MSTHKLTGTHTFTHRLTHKLTYSQALTQSHTHAQALTHSHTCIHTCALRHPYTFTHMHSHTHTLTLAYTHTRKFNRGSGTCIFELPFLPLFPCCRTVPPHLGHLSIREAEHTLQPSPELLADSFQSSLCARREHGESPRWARPVWSHSLPLITPHIAPLRQGLY